MLVALKWHRQAMAARTARGSPLSTNTTAPRVCRLPRYGWVLVMPTLNPHVLQIPQPLPSRFRPCSDPNDDAAPADWQWRFAILPLSTHSWRNDTPCRSNPVEITHQDCYSEVFCQKVKSGTGSALLLISLLLMSQLVGRVPGFIFVPPHPVFFGTSLVLAPTSRSAETVYFRTPSHLPGSFLHAKKIEPTNLYS